jgi:hypothetical protein
MKFVHRSFFRYDGEKLIDCAAISPDGASSDHAAWRRQHGSDEQTLCEFRDRAHVGGLPCQQKAGRKDGPGDFSGRGRAQAEHAAHKARQNAVVLAGLTISVPIEMLPSNNENAIGGLARACAVMPWRGRKQQHYEGQ